MHDREAIHVTLPAATDDPRSESPALDGVVVHRGPALHPDDITFVDGVPVTSVSRTLIDCAEDCTPAELRAMFDRAHGLGLLDVDELRASRGRVEWRPSLALVDELIAKYASRSG